MNAVYVSVESKVLPSYPVGDLPLWMWNDGFWISSLYIYNIVDWVVLSKHSLDMAMYLT